MDVTPTSINFGDVRVGNSGSQTVNIRNTGSSPLPVAVSLNPMTGYTFSGPANNPIPPAKIEPVTVTCTPPAAGQFNSTLTVNGGSAGSQAVSLACRGVMSNLNLTPSPTDLTTRVGESVQKTVTIQNLGTAPARSESSSARS